MSNRHENIEHPGIIDRIEDNKVWVRIQSQSACGSCHSKSMCGMAEVADKVVEVDQHQNQKQYKTGDYVTVSLKKSSGYRALFLGYLLPFILVMATLIATFNLTGNEALAALLSLGITVPYYTLLYAKRDVIKSSFRFFIKNQP
jgi:sigma-E factor negative regulatory protein RseC